MPLLNFGIVSYRVFRSAQPDAKGFADLASLGVTAIIKLNGESEYPLNLEKTQFSGIVEHIEVSTFFPTIYQVQSVVDKITNLLSYGHTVLLHCTHGRDRTGLAAGAWKLANCGYSYEQVEIDLEEFGVVGLIKLADMEIRKCLKDFSKKSPKTT